MERENEFKAMSVEAAIEKGLKKLGISREEAEIEVLSNEGGIFSKAVVRITVKKQEEAPDEEKEEINEEETFTEEETVEEEVETEEKAEVKRDERRRYDRNRHEKRERIEYFAEEKEKGKEYIRKIVEFFGGNFRVDAKSFKDEICYYISGEGANIFIGHRGETLDAIQYLANMIVNAGKTEEEQVRVTVDADFYRERRKRTLTALAKKYAEKAFRERREIALEPMNSYERRIIHAALQNSMEATTRSDGEGKDRHVVIVPKCETITYGTSAEFKKKGPKKVKSFGQKRLPY